MMSGQSTEAPARCRRTDGHRTLRACVHVEILFGIDFRVEGPVGEVIDPDPVDCGTKFRDHLNEQVVCERPLERFALQCELHRLCLIGTNKNWNKFTAGLNNDDRRAASFVVRAGTDALDCSLMLHTKLVVWECKKRVRYSSKLSAAPRAARAASSATCSALLLSSATSRYTSTSNCLFSVLDRDIEIADGRPVVSRENNLFRRGGGSIDNGRLCRLVVG